jgi:hypothetical protein
MGVRSNSEKRDCQLEPSSCDITFYLRLVPRYRVRRSVEQTHLHLPVWHVIGMSLDLLQDLLNLRRQHLVI